VAPKLVNIDAELKKAAQEAHGNKSVRASLFTLLLYVKEGERADHFNSLLEKVIAKFPCRVILMKACTQPCLDVNVSTTSIGSGNIYCETIFLNFSKEFAERIPFLVIPHLLADLPVYLLWTEDPQKENALFHDLSKWATRILFDAKCTEDLTGFSCSILKLFQEGCDVRDLGWSLLSSWRHILAQTFHDENALISLKTATEIKITAHENSVEGLYLYTWLSALFDWKQIDKTHYQTEKGELKITIASSVKPGIQEIEISNTHEGTHFQLTLEKGGNVRVLFSDQERCSLPVYDRLLLTKEEEALTREFFYPSSQTHYLLMLQRL
jgi:glucose-6-phosphate dehydrogenase assembly protein OpcA